MAVVATFARRADLRVVEGPWRAIVAPAAGAVLLIAILACSLMYFPHLVGELDATGTPAFGPICEGPWRAIVAPAAGAVLLIAILACSLMYFPHLVGELDATGTPAFGPICAVLVACAASALITGVVEACIMRRANTRAYRELERALAR